MFSSWGLSVHVRLMVASFALGAKSLLLAMNTKPAACPVIILKNAQYETLRNSVVSALEEPIPDRQRTIIPQQMDLVHADVPTWLSYGEGILTD